MSADAKLSEAMNDVADRIERILGKITGDECTPFLLLVAPSKTVQYVANVARKDGIGLIKSLLSRWQEAATEAQPDIPYHQKDRLLLRLLGALREIAAYSPASTVHPVAMAREVLRDTEPTLAFFNELSEKGPMPAPLSMCATKDRGHG